MVTLKAYGKINLCLSVTNKRADGFHDLKSLIQTVDVFDLVSVRINNTGKINVNMDCGKVIETQKNSAYLAAKNFFEIFRKQEGADIFIKKNIPFGSGMGGSSADASGVIAALCLIFNIDHTDNMVKLAASKTGSDTVALLSGGLNKLIDRGGTVQKIYDSPQFTFVVAVSEMSADTKTVFNQFDKNNVYFDETRFEQVLDNLNSNNLEEYIYNDLTEACLASYPPQKKFLEDCFSAMQKRPTLTGSGSALFWIAKNLCQAQELCKLLTKNNIKAIVCNSVPFGFKIE